MVGVTGSIPVAPTIFQSDGTSVSLGAGFDMKRAGKSGQRKSRRRRYPMPASTRRALVAGGVMDAYRARPPYQRNDYIWWVTSPAREATKQKRLAQMIAELGRGGVYMNMKWKPGR
jgi:hypothetical protein